MTDQVWGYKDGVNKFLEESGGGSSSPVGVFLKNNTDSWDLSDPANRLVTFPWPTILDNTADQNALDALPDGIGFTMDEFGYLTFTEAGVWAYNFAVFTIPDDATLAGWYGLSHADVSDCLFYPGDQRNTLETRGYQSTVQIPEGFFTSFFINVIADPTTSPCVASHAALAIIRLG